MNEDLVIKKKFKNDFGTQNSFVSVNDTKSKGKFKNVIFLILIKKLKFFILLIKLNVDLS